MDAGLVAEAIAELAPVLQADGADLILVSADGATGQIEVRLDITDASCAECVLPGPLLEQVIRDAITRRVSSPFALNLQDPRT